MTQNGISSERLRTMQIIAGALIAGVMIFAAIAIFQMMGKQPGGPVLAYMAVGFAVLALLIQAFVPAALANAATGQLGQKLGPEGAGDQTSELMRRFRLAATQAATPEGAGDQTSELVGIFQTKMIVGLAILEGAAFFNLIACIVSVQWWSLGVVGVLVLAMAMNFPTRFKVETWVENKQHELNLGH